MWGHQGSPTTTLLVPGTHLALAQSPRSLAGICSSPGPCLFTHAGLIPGCRDTRTLDLITLVSHLQKQSPTVGGTNTHRYDMSET